MVTHKESIEDISQHDGSTVTMVTHKESIEDISQHDGSTVAMVTHKESIEDISQHDGSTVAMVTHNINYRIYVTTLSDAMVIKYNLMQPDRSSIWLSLLRNNVLAMH